MQSNINDIINDSLTVTRENLKDIKSIVDKMLLAFLNNSDNIIEANKIDKKNNNGFTINLDVINNIFNNLKNEKLLYGDVTLSQKDEQKKLMYGKQITEIGNVIVINDGNPYVIIEMAMRNLMAGNTTVFVNDGYMYGTNKLLIQIMQTVLEQCNLSKYFFQLYLSEFYEEVLERYANIDLIVCIGDNTMQRQVLRKSHNEIITSGYENFDLYIEDISQKDFIDKIVNTGLNVRIFINENIDLDYDGATTVSDIDEAIGQINYTGSGYSAAIFTNNDENASQFLKEVKSKIVTVNTSPTIERIFDINQQDLTLEKTIIYPLNLKFDGNTDKLEV